MIHKGSCLCQSIKFEVHGELPQPDGCHCTACRKQTGHYLASTDISESNLKIISGEDYIKWFQSSDKVKRGFCSTCGSTLFWNPIFRDWIAIAMGAFDTPTQTKMASHIHCSFRGDYYDINDGLPQNLN